MAYNKETQIMKSIIFDKKLEKEIKDIAKSTKRSFNAQVNYILESHLKIIKDAKL